MGRFGPFCGIADGQQQQRHFVQFQAEGVSGLGHREVVHPAGPDALFPGFQHHMCGHDAGILFPGPDAVFKGVHPFLVLPDGDHEHHRCIEGAPGQSPDLFQGFWALEHVHPVGLIVVAGGSDPPGFQNSVQFLFFNRFITEFPYRISGFGQVHEGHFFHPFVF